MLALHVYAQQQRLSSVASCDLSLSGVMVRLSFRLGNHVSSRLRPLFRFLACADSH
jgi:hypothetical protein